jgi:3',5'-cyclic AMP phosphodiesterase CpdA
MRIIHLSDLHIGKSTNTARFDSIVEWIIEARSSHQSNLVLITGDIVDDGALGQYREAQRQIKRLEGEGFVVLSTPGNHDYGTNGIVESWECVARFEKYISGDVDYPHRVDVDDCMFILLDSMLQEMNDYELWGAQGELGKQQLSELDRILNEIEGTQPEKKVVVALHHHPFYYNYFLKLRDDELFKKVITDEEAGDSRVDCLLFGHKHSEKRFPSKEEKYNTGLIYASGATTERHEDGKMKIPVIDLDAFEIHEFRVA